LASYQGTYKNLSNHKAFSYARESANGKDRCGWGYGYKTVEEARKSAIEQCAKFSLNADCKIVDENGEFMAKKGDFPLINNERDYRQAIYRGNLDKIQKYISEGADVNLVSEGGISPIFIAAIKGDEAFFHQLVEKGANLRQKATDGSSLLIAAVMGENPSIVRYLLDKGLDINTQGRENNTPLHVAFGKFNTYLLGVLMQEGADPTIKNSQGISGYDLGNKWKVDLDELKTLDINQKKDGCSPVLYAAKEGDIAGLEKLAALNADMNRVCDDGLSPLAFAKNDEKVIRTLVKLGADVNTADQGGETPLMYAASDGADRVNLLLSIGADKTIKDNAGKTAYDRVKNEKSVDDRVRELLR
jgi:ankyrin repeat protein